MNNDKKSCENCKYFFRHFYWYDNKFRKSAFGHCYHHKYKSFYKMFPLKNGCKLWQENNESNKYVEKQIVTELKYMAERVNNIALYFSTRNGEAD